MSLVRSITFRERAPDAATVAYVRRARRLRARLVREPGRLHASLRELGRTTPPRDASFQRPRLAGRGLAETTPVGPTGAARFAKIVASRLDGPVLRYTQRQHLLWLGRRMNIPRFEANLIIAAVQHRVGQTPSACAPARAMSVGAIVGVILAIEVAVGAVAWGVLTY